ncbi:hypothetical protein ADUPG1_002449, partial [Aduncisulcus paluster]
MAKNLDPQTEKHLHKQLIKLGDMLGDGDCDPWVEKEYVRVLKALGIGPKPKKRNSAQINAMMVPRLQDVKCKCGGELKQSRSGSMIGKCVECGKKYRLLKR